MPWSLASTRTCAAPGARAATAPPRRTSSDSRPALDVRDVEQILDQVIHPVASTPESSPSSSRRSAVVARRIVLEHARAHRDRADRIAQIVRDDAEHFVARAFACARRVVQPRVLERRRGACARTSRPAPRARRRTPPSPARISVSAPSVSPPATSGRIEHRRERRAPANAESSRDRRCASSHSSSIVSTSSRRVRAGSTSTIGDGESAVSACCRERVRAPASARRRCRVLATRRNAPSGARIDDRAGTRRRAAESAGRRSARTVASTASVCASSRRRRARNRSSSSARVAVGDVAQARR